MIWKIENSVTAAYLAAILGFQVFADRWPPGVAPAVLSLGLLYFFKSIATFSIAADLIAGKCFVNRKKRLNLILLVIKTVLLMSIFALEIQTIDSAKVVGEVYSMAGWMTALGAASWYGGSLATNVNLDRLRRIPEEQRAHYPEWVATYVLDLHRIGLIERTSREPSGPAPIEAHPD
ncbi:MAG: hypothetical protein RLY93_01185 [Sumerlaeia bacterium]